MPRTLITGASGFIGCHLAAALARRGDEVTCMVRPTSDTRRLAPLGVRLVQGDLRDAAAIQSAVSEADLVFHLAGAMKALSGRQLWEINAEGTRSVPRACAERDSAPTLIYVSSLAAAGPAEPERPHRECDPCRPISNYGRSKRGGELAIAELAGELPASIVRPPIVFGPHDRNTLLMVRPVKRFGLLPVPGSRQRLYCFIHCEDLVEALLAVAEKGKRLSSRDGVDEGFSRGCYYAAYRQPVTYCEFGSVVADVMGRRRLRTICAPDGLVKFVGRCSDLYATIRRQPQIFSFDKARESTAGSWTCSTELIRRDCDYRPTGDLRSRMQQTVTWFFDNRWLRPRRAGNARGFTETLA